MLRAHLSLLTLSLGLPWYWRTEPTHLGVDRVALSVEVMLVEELHPPDVTDSHGRCSSRSSLVSSFVLSISIYLFTYLPTYLYHPPIPIYITHLYLSIPPTPSRSGRGRSPAQCSRLARAKGRASGSEPAGVITR